MSNHPKHRSYQHHAAGLTAAERRLAHQLDEIAEADRAAAPAGLENRLFEATRNHLPAPQPLAGPAFFSRIWHPAPLGLAACLLVAGAIGWMSLRAGAPGTISQPGGGTQVAIAELEAEVGFTLDALIASYQFESPESDSSSDDSGSGDTASFWGTGVDDDFLTALEVEVAL